VKVCRVAKNFPPRPGGLERHALDLSLVQARQGHQVIVWQGRAEPFTSSDGRLEARRLGPTPDGRLRSASFLLACTLRIVRGRLAGERWDVIHAHGDLYEAALIGLAGRLIGVPVVLTIHSGLPERRGYRALARRAFRSLRHCIVVSVAIERQWLDWGLPADRISVISSGIYPDALAPNGRDDRETGGEVLAVGRLHPVKGFSTLVEAACLLEAERPGQFRWTVIGEGSEGPALRRQAAGRAPVTFLGEVPREQVWARLRQGEIFVLPSHDLEGHREGTPTAVLEAMAAGLSCVVSDSGGLRHLVEDGESGLVVPQKDPAALAAAVARLRDDPALRRRLSERARSRAADSDWAKIARRVEEAYAKAGCAVH
jgi:colanic acid/amylovoran biosynthesis glycosyltransferase